MAGSLTGGFDVCIEISDRVLNQQALAAIQPLLAGLNGEVTRDFSEPAGERETMLSGRLHLFVTGTRLRATGADEAEVELEIQFAQSAVRLDEPVADSAAPLAGAVVFSGIPLQLVGTRALSFRVDPAAAERVSVVVTRGGAALDRLFVAAGVDPGDGRVALGNAARAYIDTFPQFTFPAGISLAPDGEEGDFDDRSFVEVQHDTRVAGDGAGGVVCLFATAARARIGRGDRRAKRFVSLSRAQSATLTIDPDAVNDLIFCPAAFHGLLPAWLDRNLPGSFLDSFDESAVDHVRRESTREQLERLLEQKRRVELFTTLLAVDGPERDLRASLGSEITAALPPEILDLVSDTRAAADRMLPPPCGTGRFPLDGAELVSLRMTLRDGFVRVSGRAIATQTAYDGDVVFRNDARLSVTEVQIDGRTVRTIALEAEQPEVVSTVHLEPWAVALAFLGIVTAFLAPLIDNLAEGKSIRDTEAALRRALSSFAPPDVPGVLGRLRDVTVTTEGLTIGLESIPMPLQTPARIQFPSLSVTRRTKETEGAPGPRQRMRIDNECLHGEYGFRDRPVQTTHILAAQPVQLDAPIRYEWVLGAGAIPPGDGVLEGEDPRDRLRYSTSGDGSVLTLSNESGSDRIAVHVSCRATDGDGLTAESAPLMLAFEGSRREWEPPYPDEVAACVREAAAAAGRGLSEGGSTVRGRGPVSRAVLDRLAREIVRGPLVDPVALRRFAMIATSRGAAARGLLAGAPALRRFARRRAVPG